MLFALTAILLGSCSSPHPPTLAIIHVTVIDMTGAQPSADQTIVMQRDRMVAIGPSSYTDVPRGARIVDGKGRFLIPGLADMHVHLTAAGEPDGSRKFMLPLLVANGITTVRDMGGYLESLQPLRREIAEGERLGPQIITSGPYLDGSPPSFQPSFVVANRAQADEDVHQLVQRHVDFIKVQSMLSREAYFAIAAAAQREQIPFVGHVPDRVTATEAAGAGQHSIEHLTNVLRACAADESKLMREQFFASTAKESSVQPHASVFRWQQRLLASYSQSNADALLSTFRAKGVWQTPTLILLKNDAFPTLANDSANDSRAEFVPQQSLDIWKQGRTEQLRFVTPLESELRAKLFAKSEDIVSQMQNAGVRLLAGTDSPAPFIFPGSSLHEELALLVHSGLTPLQALQAATSNAAEFLGTQKDSGTIGPGKYADLVLLDASPLEDIRNTEKIRAVVLRGKLLDRSTLDQMLSSVRSFATSHR